MVLKLGHLQKRDQKYLVRFEMWCWSRMLDQTCKKWRCTVKRC